MNYRASGQDDRVGKRGTWIFPQIHQNYNKTKEQPSSRTSWNVVNRSPIVKDLQKKHIETGRRGRDAQQAGPIPTCGD